MKTFKQYLENRMQEDLTSKAMTKLYYQNGLSPDVIARMGINDLSNLLQQSELGDSSITPVRFAAMVKLAARMSTNNIKINPTTPEDE